MTFDISHLQGYETELDRTNETQAGGARTGSPRRTLGGHFGTDGADAGAPSLCLAGPMVVGRSRSGRHPSGPAGDVAFHRPFPCEPRRAASGGLGQEGGPGVPRCRSRPARLADSAAVRPQPAAAPRRGRPPCGRGAGGWRRPSPRARERRSRERSPEE
ncbi:MAG: hypothetical protein ILA39_03270 [Bacteroidaceae bacterium]|nr:hypothetical protein [Bacteroidaceae bacterium]